MDEESLPSDDSEEDTNGAATDCGVAVDYGQPNSIAGEGAAEIGACLQGPMMFFSNQTGDWFSVYKAVLLTHEMSAVTRELQQLANPQTWVFLMLRGGHFAGAVFEKGQRKCE